MNQRDKRLQLIATNGYNWRWQVATIDGDKKIQGVKLPPCFKIFLRNPIILLVEYSIKIHTWSTFYIFLFRIYVPFLRMFSLFWTHYVIYCDKCHIWNWKNKIHWNYCWVPMLTILRMIIIIAQTKECSAMKPIFTNQSELLTPIQWPKSQYFDRKVVWKLMLYCKKLISLTLFSTHEKIFLSNHFHILNKLELIIKLRPKKQHFQKSNNATDWI